MLTHFKKNLELKQICLPFKHEHYPPKLNKIKIFCLIQQYLLLLLFLFHLGLLGWRVKISIKQI